MSSTDNLDTAAVVSLISQSPPDSETADLILHPSTSTSPQTTSSSSQPYQSAPQYYTAVTAETKDPQKEKLLKDSERGQSHIDQERKNPKNLKSGKKQKRRLLSSLPRMVTSLEDISSLRLWKGIVAEFIGTLLLTLVGCGSCIDINKNKEKTIPVVQIALCFGLSVATIVWSIAHISGGHINPAVTVAMLVARKISLAKAVFFILFQLIGAVVGAGILFGLTPAAHHGSLGMTKFSNITLGQAIFVEVFITFILVFTVFASCDSKRRDLNGSSPLSIGFAVTMCHLWAIDYTGSSMNTARSFGPALVMGEWENHWVYWLGPILGGVIAGLLYEHVFAVNASLAKAKACLLSSDYDDDKYKARKIKEREYGTTVVGKPVRSISFSGNYFTLEVSKIQIIEEEDPVMQENDEFPLSEKEQFSSKISNA